VPADQKAPARETVIEWLNEAVAPPTQRWVRVNADPGLMAVEISALAQPSLAGVIIPKVEDASQMRAAVRLVADAEIARGLTPGALSICALIETAAGVLNVGQIAAVSGVSALAIGEGDLGGELGIDPSDEEVFSPIRLQVLIASVAARLPIPPIGPVHLDVRDTSALRGSCERLRRMGFRSRAAVHPDQVSAVNEVFSSRPQEVERARAIVDAYRNRQDTGRGAIVGGDGRLVDEAIVRAAELVLKAAGDERADPQ
ncbi:MAG TPA: aldolase/citrate lyase family protein, partial [Acidimicrobiia bacterium]|nr:aldolase/citrate lyase family protein [Acidimicrobiia bacterium]